MEIFIILAVVGAGVGFYLFRKSKASKSGGSASGGGFPKEPTGKNQQK